MSSYIETSYPHNPMPVLFLGHGNPMNAIEENEFVIGFREIAKTLPTPKAILCISAHWFIRGTNVTAMQNPQTIHDFGGFPQELFEVIYPAPGDPALAEHIQSILSPTSVELDYDWGLDHGTWSVLTHLYPSANIPVVQLSIDSTQLPHYHYEMGKKLRVLRDQGVLIIGSGNIIHNLSLVDWKNLEKRDYGYPWAHESHTLINQAILTRDHQQLIHTENLPQSVKLAIPTLEHYLPLLYILGLSEIEEPIHIFNDLLVGGSLSMTSLKIGY